MIASPSPSLWSVRGYRQNGSARSLSLNRESAERQASEYVADGYVDVSVVEVAVTKGQYDEFVAELLRFSTSVSPRLS